jgi:hypothetical protein
MIALLYFWLAPCRRSFHSLTLPRFFVPKCFLFHRVCDTLLTRSSRFALSSLCPIFSLASCFESFPVFKVEVPFLPAPAVSNAASLHRFFVLPVYLYHGMLVLLHLRIYTLHRPSLDAGDFAHSRRFQNTAQRRLLEGLECQVVARGGWTRRLLEVR